MTTLRYLGEDYCEVFDHGFLPGEWVGPRELTDEQFATLLANPQFEAGSDPREVEPTFPEGWGVVEGTTFDAQPPAKAATKPTKPRAAKPAAKRPRKAKASPRRAKAPADLHAAT